MGKIHEVDSDEVVRATDSKDLKSHDVLNWFHAQLADTKLISAVVQPLSVLSR